MRAMRPETASALLSLIICLFFLGTLSVPALGALRPFAGVPILLYLFGLSLRAFLRVSVPADSTRSFLTPAGIAMDLLASLALVTLLSMALALTFQLWASFLVGVIVGPCLALNVGTLLVCRLRPNPAPTRRPVDRSVLEAVALLASVSGILFILFRWPTAYPSVSGWDLNPTLATVGWTLGHGGFGFILIAPYPASALVPYPASFGDLIAGYSLFLGVDPLAIFYYGVLVMLLAYSLGVFAIAYRLSNRVDSALLAALAILFMGTALPETVRTPLFVTIDMLAQLVFFGLFLFFLDDQGSLGRRRAILLIGSAFLVYWYFYELVVVTPFLAFMLGESLRSAHARRPVRWFRWTLVIVLLGVVGVSLAATLFVPSLEANLSAGFQFVPKVSALVVMYSPVALVLGVLIVFNRAHAPEDPPVRGFRARYLLEYVCVYVIIYLLPLSATYRVEFYLRAALAFYLASLRFPTTGEMREAFRAARGLLARRRAPRPWHPLALQRLAALAVLALVVFMAVLLPFQVTQPEPYMSLDEYRASVWIRDHTPADAYIVTDPGTGYVIRGLSLRNASLSFLLPDGRAPDDSSSLYPYLRTSLHFIFDSYFTAQAQEQVLSLNFPHLYVVISTRTVLWASTPAVSIFDHPIPGLSPVGLLPVFAPPAFQPLFVSPTVVVLSVNT